MIRSDLDRVLVVDDEPAIVDLMELYLKSDYEIIRAYNGKEALEKARSQKPSVIILDVMMPDMNGYEVCKVLKTSVETQFIPIIMVTALSGKDEKIKGLESGADEFLSKPVNRLELVTRVKSLTRIKHLQDRILAERNYAYQCIDVAGVIMLVVDREQKINLVNRTGNDSLGYDEFELIGQNMFDVLVLPEEREKEKEDFLNIINGMIENLSPVERKILKKNGDTIIVSWSHSPMYDSEGNIEALICSGKDITELRRKDEILLGLNEIKETFSDMLHQDLLGSASTIQEYAKVLLEQETKPQNEAYIQKIVQSISDIIETLENASTYLERQFGERTK
jgi:two-component system cell cycle response regulator